MQLFYTVRLIMFPSWLAIVITFYFFVWLLIDENWLSIFYFCEKKVT